MSSHNTNKLLKLGLPVLGGLLVFGLVTRCSSGDKPTTTPAPQASVVQDKASGDSAAEALNTLTSDMAAIKQQVAENVKANQQLQNQLAQEKLQQKKSVPGKSTINPSSSPQDSTSNSHEAISDRGQPLTVVHDLTVAPTPKVNLDAPPTSEGVQSDKPKIIPYYTIPANATSVNDKLMTALVGRIPVKGIVSDPYPFKIVVSDDTLAANGLRIPHLKQMIVGGYSEGDLNLLSARGWITSLTFVFQDGTISSISSNSNNIGKFTKDNALGYLSDPQGNPFLRGKLITNAPAYLTGNVALGAAEGAASAYAQSQVSNQNTLVGSIDSTVTGSAGKFVAGQAMTNAASQVQKWWSDREQNSFDAIYVEPGQDITVNFTKEIDIDYNPTGRKLAYEHHNQNSLRNDLD